MMEAKTDSNFIKTNKLRLQLLFIGTATNTTTFKQI